MDSSAGDPEGGIQHSSQYSGESGKSVGSGGQIYFQLNDNLLFPSPFSGRLGTSIEGCLCHTFCSLNPAVIRWSSVE